MKRPNNKPNLSGFAQSGLSRIQPKPKEQMRQYLNGKVQAKRMVIPACDVEAKTAIHPLNPRNQKALTKDAVRDILASIQDNGVNVEGVAIFCPHTEKFLLLDASRRRFSCILTAADLPLWVLEPTVTDEQILAIINDSQEIRKWSYPEHASYLLTVAKRKKLDVESMKIEELAKALAIGRESLRKRLEAMNVSRELREIFIDYEGIPNAFYSRLAKVERAICKGEKTVKQYVAHLTKVAKGTDLSVDVVTSQEAMMKQIELNLDSFLGNAKPKREWKTESLATFDDNKVYARVSRSPDRNTIKFELARIEADKVKKIEAYISQILNEKP